MNTLQPQRKLDSTEEGLKRGLQARHMSMIAIGGAIGTGLFIASGASVAAAGPGGALPQSEHPSDHQPAAMMARSVS